MESIGRYTADNRTFLQTQKWINAANELVPLYFKYGQSENRGMIPKVISEQVLPEDFASVSICIYPHCVKSVRIRSFSGPYFPAFGLNTERYGVSLHIQSECGKIRPKKTPNTDTFHAAPLLRLCICR